jgi:uncharacterized RDD family membrane protein YckC
MPTSPHQQADPANLPPPGLLRRLAAIVYDTLLVFALLMLVTLPFVLLNLGRSPFHQSALVLTIFAFFAKFWRHGGQTLGMKSWHMQIVSDNGQPISFSQCLLRLVAATLSFLCFGAGYFWMLIDKNKRTWADRFSDTHLVMTPKREKLFSKK